MRKGFTLVELLAVIAIISMVAVITTPIIINVIENSRRQAAEASAKGYARAVEQALLNVELGGEELGTGEINTSTLVGKVEYSGKTPETNSTVTISSGELTGYSLKFSGYTCTKSGCEKNT